MLYQFSKKLFVQITIKTIRQTQLRDSRIILEQLMRSSIVSYCCTEDGQKVGRNVYRTN